ncbi:helix-turn-helix domain-containing protein [Streptomyces sp. NPDC088097]|uniref:helix-turn-helix domain-containing protein n=1 Tax=Streptomyces sp. NPDC088097 TaxID=3365823 RepID=UPI0037FBA171
MTTSSTLSLRTARRADKHPLPDPHDRRGLRESWGLTPGQVAAAFGVTAATVRSWESGRTAPTGPRREAYRRFLLGLAQRAEARSEPVVPDGCRPARPAAQVPDPRESGEVRTGEVRTGEVPRQGPPADLPRPEPAPWEPGLGAAAATLSAWVIVLVLLGTYLPGWID